VPKKALPAFHRVEEGDVDNRKVSRHGLGEDDVRSAGGIVGHVTLTALGKGKVVAADDLTKDKTGYANLVPVPVHAAAAAGSPRSGDEIWLLFAPGPGSGSATPLEIPALLLESSGAKAGGTDYVVAVSSQDRTKLLRVLGRSRLVVVAG
jgi:hypothetical protein